MEYDVLPHPPESKSLFGDKRVIAMAVVIVILIIAICFLVFYIYAKPVPSMTPPSTSPPPTPPVPQTTEHERVVASASDAEIAKYAKLTEPQEETKSDEDEENALEAELAE